MGYHEFFCFDRGLGEQRSCLSWLLLRMFFVSKSHTACRALRVSGSGHFGYFDEGTSDSRCRAWLRGIESV